MGLTPLEGLVMGTRSGDIDPAILEYVGKKENKNIDQLMEVLNKKSGRSESHACQATDAIWRMRRQKAMRRLSLHLTFSTTGLSNT